MFNNNLRLIFIGSKDTLADGFQIIISITISMISPIPRSCDVAAAYFAILSFKPETAGSFNPSSAFASASRSYRADRSVLRG